MANNFGTGLNALHKVCKTAEEIDDDTFNITLSYEDIEALKGFSDLLTYSTDGRIIEDRNKAGVKGQFNPTAWRRELK